MNPPRSVITRDLTPKFNQLRREGQASEQEKGRPLLGSPGSADREFQRSILPPQWVDHSDEAQETIKVIRDKLNQLTKAQQRRLLNVFRVDSAPDAEVEMLSKEIALLIRRCEKAIHEVKNASSSSTENAREEEELRRNMQRGLAAQLQQVSKQCRETQREYLEEVRRRQGGPQNGDRPAGGTLPPEHRSYQDQMLAQELDGMEAFAGQRSAEICQIASAVDELNCIFKELAELVIEQGTVLDRIDFNVENVHERGVKANQHIQKAVKIKKAADSRALKCIMVLAAIDALLVLILIIKYKIKYGWSAAGVLWFLLILGGSLFGAGYIVWYRPPWCPLAQRLPTICPSFDFDIKRTLRGWIVAIAQRFGWSAPVAQGLAHSAQRMAP